MPVLPTTELVRRTIFVALNGAMAGDGANGVDLSWLEGVCTLLLKLNRGCGGTNGDANEDSCTIGGGGGTDVPSSLRTSVSIAVDTFENIPMEGPPLLVEAAFRSSSVSSCDVLPEVIETQLALFLLSADAVTGTVGTGPAMF